MGHQLNFYLMAQDFKKLQDGLKKKTDFLYVCNRSSVNTPEVVDDVIEREWIYYYLVRPQDLDKIFMRKVQRQSYWTVDDSNSLVIQFQKSFLDGRRLKAGRLWFETRYLSSGAFCEKPNDFIDWADGVLKTCRKSLTKNGEFYFGDEALAILKDGAHDIRLSP